MDTLKDNIDGATPSAKSISRFGYDEYTKVYETIPDDDSELKSLLEQMKANHKKGALRDLDFRIQQLNNLKTVIEANQNEMAESLKKDLGRNDQGASSEVSGIIHHIDFVAGSLKEWAKDIQVDTPPPIAPGTSYIKWEALGVICVMGAWNFPFVTTINPLLYVIAAGNGAVIKPSELSPRSSKIMNKVLTEGLDQSLYRVCEGKAKIAVGLNNLPFDMFVFTGSTQKGRLCAQSAAKNLVPCVLELGGKSPLIVDESADCNQTAKKILMGKMMNTGQICIAPDYSYCHESKVNELISELKDHLKNAYNNNDNDEGGKIINEFHHKRLCSLLADHEGEVVIGNPNAHQDLNLQPTVILNPNLKSKVMQDEIFGPILPLIVYKEFDEVIDHITSGDKPLASYFFGNPKGENFQRFLNEVSAGAVATNEVVMQVANKYLPFGGVGASGYGRYHGIWGYQQFSNPKSILVKDLAGQTNE